MHVVQQKISAGLPACPPHTNVLPCCVRTAARAGRIADFGFSKKRPAKGLPERDDEEADDGGERDGTAAPANSATSLAARDKRGGQETSGQLSTCCKTVSDKWTQVSGCAV
jgi:hypothetical protein